VSDQFLELFLPGPSARLALLRDEVHRINVAHKNHRVVRSVLLVGERGTGKSQLAEVVAAHLHWLRNYPDGSRNDWKDWPFKRLGVLAGLRRQTLTALPDELAESALFGHKRGAFTGANADFDGAFKSPGDVDLLLDEIGDATPNVQAKLLEVLETGLFRPLGARWDDNVIETQVRVLAATNRNLSADVSAKAFRADLLDRLSTFVIALPPLRESRDQIPAVLGRVLGSWSTRFGHAEIPAISDADRDFVLNRYEWPGNIRELEHAVTAWLMWGGQRALSDLVLQNAERLSQGVKALDPDSALRADIRSHLVLVSQRGAPRYGSFGEFSGRYGDIGVEVLDDLNRRGPVDLGSLFSCSVAAVQSQLSGWRGRRGARSRRGIRDK